MKAVLKVAVLCVSLISVIGCAVSQKTAFGFNGMPKKQYCVGGGLEISYTAPQDGTCYLVDQKSGKFVVTESISEGSTFDFDLSSADPDKYGSLIQGNLVLYFVPEQQIEQEE